ncbi:YceI family protein [Azoarcus taiwanensis]|uniref:Polyisoprenoid-binding protein n=1 Tax=Azoarcus taiwanensis TaxID=666964 RepID=A0A972F686_9RHOO|nr:YceI family protein [Azoarcus taiwanensis]NMG02231.1 polyisoprenoid-binding protein [Azoarcus taiwanensis]
MNRLTRLAATLALGAGLALPAFAAPETYVIDDSHTFPRFSYSHFGLSTQQSKFDRASGTVTIDREARTGEVEIVIDMTSVNTGYADFNDHIQGEDFLNTAVHPTATFKSTQVVFDGDTPTAIEGELTIKGITRPVTLEITRFTAMPHPMLQRDAIGADATTTILRSDFEAGMFAPAVSDEVRIDIAVEAIKAE